MKKTLIVLTAAGLLSFSGYLFASEGKEVTMLNQEIANADKKIVEVGNKICPVSGDKIPTPGEKVTMGDKPVQYEYNGKIYNLCCPMCTKDFKKNPEKYSKIAEDEVAKEKMMRQEENQKGVAK